MASPTGLASHTTAIASATPACAESVQLVSVAAVVRSYVLLATVIVGVTLSARIDAVVAVVVDVR